jgi:hypothetical protein
MLSEAAQGEGALEALPSSRALSWGGFGVSNLFCVSCVAVMMRLSAVVLLALPLAGLAFLAPQPQRFHSQVGLPKRLDKALLHCALYVMFTRSEARHEAHVWW